MKHIVEFFDGRKIRGVLVEQNQLSSFLSKLNNLDPSLGAIVLDISPESSRQTKKRQQRIKYGPSSIINPERTARVDQFLV